jgi:hypothetical protein
MPDYEGAGSLSSGYRHSDEGKRLAFLKCFLVQKFKSNCVFLLLLYVTISVLIYFSNLSLFTSGQLSTTL